MSAAREPKIGERRGGDRNLNYRRFRWKLRSGTRHLLLKARPVSLSHDLGGLVGGRLLLGVAFLKEMREIAAHEFGVLAIECEGIVVGVLIDGATGFPFLA